MQHLLRNKITTIFFAFLLCPFLGFSQLRTEPNMPDHDDKPYHFGINIGMNSSHFNYLLHPYFMQNDSVGHVESLNNMGLNLAWLVNFRLGKHFDLRTYPLNLTFSEKDFRYFLKYPIPFLSQDSITTQKLQSITMSLPVQIKFTSDRIDNFKVYMMGGANASYDLASNSGTTNSGNLIKLNRFDFGVQAGVGFHFYFPYFVLSPELKFDWGLKNLLDRDPTNKFSSAFDKINARAITFSITVE